MKINQVEELVGIDAKNIRFYEDEGLLKPNRNPLNGYREYNLKDVEVLKKIKLLRKLSVSIEDIKDVLGNKKSLNDCLENQIIKLGKIDEDVKTSIILCEKIFQGNNDIDTLDCDEYLEEIKNKEKGGSRFMDINKDAKKKMESWIAALFMICFMLVMIGIMTWAYKQDPTPWFLVVFTIAIFVIVIIGVVIALVERMKEIDKGEANEASKY